MGSLENSSLGMPSRVDDSLWLSFSPEQAVGMGRSLSSVVLMYGKQKKWGV